MIAFKRFVLSNGLRVIVHEDKSTPFVSCNVVYNVGSKDENPDFTGMAHLFEHYMFSGSKNIPDYDFHLQKIGAVNNAFTTQDLTQYYSIVPANNFEIPLWLEADRMLELAFNERQLEVQKHVVSEEFKENFLNVPFGDMWLIFNNFLYNKTPYKWLPIGKSLDHIAKVDMPLMKDFYYRFYRPNNAVLVLAGNVVAEEVMPAVEKWFGDIPAAAPKPTSYPEDSPQTAERRLTVKRAVPYDMLIKGWKCCGRLHDDFYALDLISDLFGSGHSSFLYKKFVIDEKLFVDLTAYISETLLTNVFMIIGNPAEGVSIEEADKKLSDFLYAFKYNDDIDTDLQKVKNKAESALLAGEIRPDDRASALGIAETFSEADAVLHRRDKYFAVDTGQLHRVTHNLFLPETCNTLFYKAEK